MDTENPDFLDRHIIDCLRAAIAEARGETARARRMRAQSKLRLVCMTDDEVWELAGRTRSSSRRLQQEGYLDMKRTIAEYRRTTDKWLCEAFGPLPDPLPDHPRE